MDSDLAATVLWDHLGPGRHAVSVGTDGWDDCSVDSWIWDLMQPPGRSFRFDEAPAWFEGSSWSPLAGAGDLDRDGHPDVVISGSRVVRGPLSGRYWRTDNLDDQAIEILNGDPMTAVGDINGDGEPELLARRRSGATGGNWMLLFSPHPDPLNLDDGLFIGAFADHVWEIEHVYADLDGDGRSDLLDPHTGGTADGQLDIYYGRDLLEAWERRQQQAGR